MKGRRPERGASDQDGTQTHKGQKSARQVGNNNKKTNKGVEATKSRRGQATSISNKKYGGRTKVCQWNVRGLGDHNRVKRVQTWVKKSKNMESILCIQETKIKAKNLKFKLKLIDPEAIQVIDVDTGDRVGAVLLIPKGFDVVTIGTKGDGTFSWAMVKTNKGTS